MKIKTYKSSEEIKNVQLGDKIKYLNYFVYKPQKKDWLDGVFVGYDDSYGCELEHGEHRHVFIKNTQKKVELKCEHVIMEEDYLIKYTSGKIHRFGKIKIFNK